MRSTTPWVWVNCEKCPHHAPLACDVLVIRWGVQTRQPFWQFPRLYGALMGAGGVTGGGATMGAGDVIGHGALKADGDVIGPGAPKGPGDVRGRSGLKKGIWELKGPRTNLQDD